MTELKRGKMRAGLSGSDRENLLRIIDANLNRSTEGLRVCEDISRFVLNSKRLHSSFKSLRHRIKLLNMEIAANFDFVSARDVRGDVGITSKETDFPRAQFFDLFRANAQRAKEALRTLEEVTKLLDARLSENFKRIRFSLYDEEKYTFTKFKHHKTAVRGADLGPLHNSNTLRR